MPRKPSTRTTTAAFSQAETDAFLAGQWVPVDSTWITGASWDAAALTLTIGLPRGGVTTLWADRARAEAFAAAPSKGGALWDWGWRPRP